MKKILVIIAVLLTAICFYGYFFVISPVFVSKPAMAKPLVPGPNESVDASHVEWIVNEIGAYRLHPSLGGEPAVLELVTDSQVFTVTITNNKPAATEGAAANPDMRIRGSRESIVAMLTTNNINKEVVAMHEQGLISIELLKDEATLAAKGYKAVYDELSK